MKKKEESLQLAVSKYLKLKYPDVVFTSESSGIRLTIGQAIKAKAMRSSDKLPDMIILEPSQGYSGMALELKKEGETVFKKDGNPVAGRVAEQYKTLQKLSKKGYFATFGIGIDNAINLIDSYLGNKEFNTKKIENIKL